MTDLHPAIDVVPQNSCLEVDKRGQLDKDIAQDHTNAQGDEKVADDCQPYSSGLQHLASL